MNRDIYNTFFLGSTTFTIRLLLNFFNRNKFICYSLESYSMS